MPQFIGTFFLLNCSSHCI